jgi:hypothetical protein
MTAISQHRFRLLEETFNWMSKLSCQSRHIVEAPPKEATVRYLILIHSNPLSRKAWEGFSQAERAEGLRAYATLHEELVASGELIVAEPLADPSLAKRVTVRDGQTMTTDGPFAEAKEQLAGFFLVECERPARAIEIAGRVPEATLGLIEVRPVLDRKGLEM